MEFLIVIWSVILACSLYRVITSGEQFIDRWLRVKEGRPLQKDIINYYPGLYEWSLFKRDRNA